MTLSTDTGLRVSGCSPSDPNPSSTLASLLPQSQRLPTTDRLLVRLEPKTSPFNNHPKASDSAGASWPRQKRGWGRTGCSPVKNNCPRGGLSHSTGTLSLAYRYSLSSTNTLLCLRQT
ncbi:hypothetical protein GQ457_04G016360 [Hibiscus cannabinus]